MSITIKITSVDLVLLPRIKYEIENRFSVIGTDENQLKIVK